MRLILGFIRRFEQPGGVPMQGLEKDGQVRSAGKQRSRQGLHSRVRPGQTGPHPLRRQIEQNA